jgi:hypothetical protein
MKDLRTRRGVDTEVDLEGPTGWSRGDAWDDEKKGLQRPSMSADSTSTSTRPR